MIDLTKFELVIKNKEKAVVKMPTEEYYRLIVSNEVNGMCFSKAYEALKQGAKIARKIWGGYWVKENDTIMMYCKNGLILDIRYTSDVFFTFDNIVANDWIIVNDRKILTFAKYIYSYEDAVRFLKAGYDVYREKWAHNNLLHLNGRRYIIPYFSNIIIKKTYRSDDSFVYDPYIPTHEDLFAKDWCIISED